MKQCKSIHKSSAYESSQKSIACSVQDEIIECLRSAVEQKLVASNDMRTYSQTQLPFAPLGVTKHTQSTPTATQPVAAKSVAATQRAAAASVSAAGTSTPAAAPSYYRPDKMVRTDPRTATLDAFFSKVTAASQLPPAAGSNNQTHTLTQLPDSAAATAAALAGAGVRRKRGAVDAGLDLDLDPGQGVTGSGSGSKAGSHDRELTQQHQLDLDEEDEGGLFARPGLHALTGGGSDTALRNPQSLTEQDGVSVSEAELVRARSGTPGAVGAQGSRYVRQRRNPVCSSELSSVQELVAEFSGMGHAGLGELLRNHTFVGMVGCRVWLVSGDGIADTRFPVEDHTMTLMSQTAMTVHTKRLFDLK